MSSMFIIIIALAMSVFLNVFLKRFNIPTIIGYIFTGTAIAYLFDLQNSPDLAHIAEFGIVFLMFTIGLEFSIKHLKQMKHEVFVNGLLQVSVTGLLFMLFFYYILAFPAKSAIITGLALALSSTAIVLKLFNESGAINAGFGRKTLGILLFQDIAVIPILLMITIFTKEGVALSELLLESVVSAAIVLAILFVFGKFALNRFFEQVSNTESSEIFIATVLLVVIGASYLAHAFGFSYSLGAFIAGMLIAETRFKYQIEADLIPFRDILLGIFFITVGLQINFETIFDYYDKIIIALVGILLIKSLLIYAIVRASASKRVAFKTALSLFQVGEFALAILELANFNNLIAPMYHQVFIVTVVISMIMTPFVLKKLTIITDAFMKEPELENDFSCEEVSGHTVVCGYGMLGQHIVFKLKEEGVNYVAIEHNERLVRLGKERGENVIFGNAANKAILEKVAITKASCVIVAIKNEEKLRLMCEILHAIKSDMNIIVRVADHKEKKLIDDLRLNHIININDVLADMFVKESLDCSKKP